MALTERLSVKRRNSSRSNSQSSVETETSSCDRLSVKSDPCQSPMSLAQIISSTYKHSPNLLIPHPAFLKLLKTVGAKGERFVRDSEIYTVQQLCFYLKEYIKQKQLYDVNDVHVVYCRCDPLGDVFHVERFTIYDVLDLISKTSTPLLLSPSKNKIAISSDSKSTDLQKVKPGGVWKFSDEGASVAADCTEKLGNESSPKRSAASVNLSRLFSRHSGARGNELTCNFVTSTTDSVKGGKRSLEEEEEVERLPEKRLCIEKTTAETPQVRLDSGEERQTGKEAVVEQQFLLPVRDDAAILGEISDVESIYSIQSKETALVKDSSDDLWFLKDEDDVDCDSDVYSEIYADEYDVVSDLSQGSSSAVDDDDFDDNDVFAAREDIVVIYDGSETDFADGELSDIEESTTLNSGAIERTSWQCIKCCHRNRAPDRLCDECLNLRTEELIHGESSAAPGSIKNETALPTFSLSDDIPPSLSTAGDHLSDRQFPLIRCHSETDLCVRESCFDSSPQFTSSQESGFFSADLDDVVTPLAKSSYDSSTVRNTEVGRIGVCRTEVSRDVIAGSNEKLGQPSISLNLCIICLSEPKVASLIHGASGHQVCCYQCALQLKRMRKPCPVCRRPIDKVIRNYFG